MACTNCSNNCVEITSDQCVKYTGEDITALGISTGDNLCSVIQNISTFLDSVIDATGIVPACTSTCDLVAFYLTQEEPTLKDVLEALIQSVCSLQEDVTSQTAQLVTIEDDYNVDCLSGVTASSGTHDILQAVITKLCTLDTSVANILVDLSTDYVALADLNDLIQDYLDANVSSLISNRMVPYVAMPFFPTDSYLQGKFGSTGEGLNEWARVFLCNGRNGTPDMRGRVPVCATEGMSGLSYNSVVDPAITGNPSYSVRGIYGTNNTTLTVNEMPVHTHTATGTVAVPAHDHFIAAVPAGDGPQLSNINYLDVESDRPAGNNHDYHLWGTTTTPTVGKTSTNPAATLNLTITNTNTGATTAKHENIQPVIAAYYIMYIPST